MFMPFALKTRLYYRYLMQCDIPSRHLSLQSLYVMHLELITNSLKHACELYLLPFP